ncbi:hypothetical protein KC19_9G069000 [Ceratodon purpureus]|uniref:Uncharacterized protein n=1 Tax=Ceratodon purpureus TaxID=3225 RepID=A0A8T0GSD0_CERPU|nr:hypothetical protein KC19_9G069000 [Ceratodon purpureus]
MGKATRTPFQWGLLNLAEHSWQITPLQQQEVPPEHLQSKCNNSCKKQSSVTEKEQLGNRKNS